MARYYWVAAVWGIFFLFTSCSSTGERGDLDPKDRAFLLVRIADGALQEGDPTGALHHLKEAERYNPKLPQLHHARALAFIAKKDLKTALNSAQKAVELDPQYAAGNNTFGKLLLDMGKYSRAEEYLKRAAKDPLYRGEFKARTNLGMLYYRQKKYKKALSEVNRATELAPRSACVAYYYRGHLHLRVSRFQEAIEDYKNATKNFCGHFAEGHLALGVAYLRSNDIVRARKKFLEIQTLFPDSEASKKAMAKLGELP